MIIIIVLIFCFLIGCAPQVRTLKYDELRGKEIYYAKPLYKEGDENQKYFASILHGEMLKYNMTYQNIYKSIPYFVDSLLSISYKDKKSKDVIDLISPNLEENGVEYLLFVSEIYGKCTEPDTTTRGLDLDYPIPIPIPFVGIAIIDTEGELGEANKFDYIHCTATLIDVINRKTVFSIPLRTTKGDLAKKRGNKPIDFIHKMFELIYQDQSRKTLQY